MYKQLQPSRASWLFLSSNPQLPCLCNRDEALNIMRLSSILAGAALCLASSSHAINILLNNDDGFGSGNLREVYRILKEKGHNGLSNPSSRTNEPMLTQPFAVWIVAPATKQSGQGGASDFTEYGNLTGPSQYDLIPAGAPSVSNGDSIPLISRGGRV